MSVGVEQRLDRFWRYLDKHFVAARLFPILWILAIGGITFLWKLGSTGLVDETEPLFAEAARQMVETGDWITPYFNGVTRFDKPPLIYWLMAIAYKIIGVNEWAARLPSALSAIALMGMGFYILRRFGTFTPGVRASSNQRWLAALIGSALIALHPLTIIWAKTGVSDMLLSGCVGLALMSFFCGYGVGEQSEVRSQEPGVRSQKVEEEVEERDDAAGNLGIKIQNSKSLRLGFPTFQSVPFSGCYLGFYVFVALAVLTKGPVGIVLPGLIVGTFLLYVGNFKTVLREMRPLWGFLVILVLALPWYILVTLANGETFIDSFFGYHNIERFTSVVNHHWAPWYFYFVIVLLGFAPWSLYLPSAIARLQFWKRSIWRNQPRSSHLGLFAFFWFACVFGFFTIAVTKLPSYVLPLMPAAAILVALLWSEQMAQPIQPSWGIKLSSILNGLFFLVVAGVLIYTPQLVKNDRAMPNLAPLLQQSGLPILGGLIAIATTALVWLLLLRRQTRWVWLANVVGALLLIVFVLVPATSIVDSQRQLPLRQLAQIAVEKRLPGEELIMIGEKKPSVVFYTRQPVTFKLRSKTAVTHLREKAATQSNAPTTLILTAPDRLPAIGLQPNQYQTLGKAGPYELVRIPKDVLPQLPSQ